MDYFRSCAPTPHPQGIKGQTRLGKELKRDQRAPGWVLPEEPMGFQVKCLLYYLFIYLFILVGRGGIS